MLSMFTEKQMPTNITCWRKNFCYEEKSRLQEVYIFNVIDIWWENVI